MTGPGKNRNRNRNKEYRKRIDSGYSIQVRLRGDYEGGRTIYGVSETEFVHVNSGFMAKLIRFFRHLFNPGAYRISQ